MVDLFTSIMRKIRIGGYHCIVEVKNKYMSEKEYFYDVPIDKFYEIEINTPPYWIKET